MRKTGLAALAAIWTAGCASYPQPTEHLANSMAAVRGAEEAGAEQVPQAALYLKLAQEELDQANRLLQNDENKRADALTIRAYNDAQLALALAREQQAQDKLAAFTQESRGAEPSAPPATQAEPPSLAPTTGDESAIP
jgi:hypothetical protein